MRLPKPYSLKYASMFVVMSMLCANLALSLPRIGLVLLWPTTAFAIVALSYAAVGPRVFGKASSSGRVSPLASFVLLPYLLPTWITWHLVKVFPKEDAFNPLNDRIVVGRRLLRSEYPANIAAIVDLTAEFSEALPVGVEYTLYSFLDAAPIRVEDLHRIATAILATPSPTYLHCAQGHGRTSLVAAAVLLKQDSSLTCDEALEAIAAVRPLAKPNKAQLIALRKFADSRLLEDDKPLNAA